MSSSNQEKEPANDRSHPNFVESYTHTDRDSDSTEIFVSPFAVSVFGIHKEFFGVGQVIGAIDDNPVIEVIDIEDGNPYCVMGYESWWKCPVPSEIIDGIASGELAIDSVATYRKTQDEYWETIQSSDAGFLSDNGIDPETV